MLIRAVLKPLSNRSEESGRNRYWEDPSFDPDTYWENEKPPSENDLQRYRQNQDQRAKLQKLVDPYRGFSYRMEHPVHGLVTWSGKGRAPRWVEEIVEGGGSLEGLKVDE